MGGTRTGFTLGGGCLGRFHLIHVGESEDSLWVGSFGEPKVISLFAWEGLVLVAG